MAKKETQRQDVALEVVCNIGRAVAAEMKLVDLLELIYREAGRVIETDCFALALYDPLEDGLRFELLYDKGERLPAMTLPRSEGWGLAGQVFEERSALLFQDLDESDLPEGAIRLGDVPRSWLGVPLVARDRAIGVMSVQNYEPDAFGAEDQRLLEAITSQAAVAIENLYLRREHERGIAELASLSEIGQAIITTTRLEDLLDVLYEQTSRIMDTSNLYIALYHTEEQQVSFELFMQDGERIFPQPLNLSDGGMTVHIVKSKQPVLLGEEDMDREMAELGIGLVGRPAASYLGVPMLAGDEVVGVLSVQNPERRRAFDRRHQNLLSHIANLAAVAIENTRLFQERERRMAEQGILTEIARVLSSALALDELVERVYQQVSRIFDTTNFYIATYDQETDEWELVIALERGERYSLLRRKVGAGLTGHIIRTRQPLLLRSMEENLAFHEEHGIPYVGERSLSWMGVPLVAADKVVGVMAIQSYEQAYLYDESDLALFMAVAAQTAIAIDNAHLFAELETRLNQLAALQEVGQTLSQILDLEAVLDTALESITTTLGFSYGVISMVDEKAGQVRAVCGYGVPEEQIAQSYQPLDSPDIMADIVRTGKIEIIDGWDDRFDREIFESYGHADLVRVFAPLVARGSVIGLIEAGYPREFRDSITQRDIEVLKTFLNQASIAIDNASLFRGWQARLTDLSIMNEVAQTILTAESEEDILETIFNQVKRVMDTANYYVALYDEAENMLDFVYYVEGGEHVPGPGRYSATGGGLTGHIVQRREPLFLVEDVNRQLAERGIEGRGRPARSYLGVPMLVADHVVGAIAVQSYEAEHAYTVRHLDLLTNIATQAAIAMQRMRLQGSEARKARQLSIIGEVSRKVTAVLDLDELLRELARSIQLGFGYSNVAVMQVEDVSRELVLGALVGRYAGIMEWGFRQSTKEGLIGLAVRTGETVLCNNVQDDPRYIRGFDAEELTMSELCVPISYAGRVIGVLDIQSEVTNAFDREDVAAMETLAGQLAAAMRNAILFRERSEQLANMNALNRVIRETTVAASLEELLRSLCDVVVELMNPDGFFVALQDAQSGALVAPLLLDEGIFYENYVLAGKGFTPYMMETGQPVLIRNMIEDGARYPVERTTHGSGRHSASWLGVPFGSPKPIGAIVVQSYRPYVFDESDMEFLQAVANQVVVNIEKARLFEETQRALEELRESSERQRQLLNMVTELSTPLVPITDEILVLPLIGTVDSVRAQQMMDALLEGIGSRRARVVILDITGVPVVDTSVANYILQATQAVRLLGAECILVGITPEVAQTVVGLGVDLKRLTTRSDLQGGVEYALRLMGQRISKRARQQQQQQGAAPTRNPADPKARTPKQAPPSP